MNKYLRFCVTDFVEATKGTHKGHRPAERWALSTTGGAFLVDKKGQLVAASDRRLLHSI